MRFSSFSIVGVSACVAVLVGACGGGATPQAQTPVAVSSSSSSSTSSSSSSSSSSTGGGAGSVSLNVRVQGLGLGGQLSLSHAGASLQATLNQPYSFSPQVAAGAPLNLAITAQPAGQVCALSSAAPSTVPADASPVFVRCVTQSTARVTMPDTVPNDTLNVSFGLRDSAFPGMPYESRPGVVGGIFPYEYRVVSLSFNGAGQSTAGVSLDFRRGTLRFTPASTGVYVLTIEIKDSGSTQKTLQQSFTITAAVAPFLFVAPDGLDAVGRGGLTAPFKTVAYAIANSTPNQIIMLRKGLYSGAGINLYDSKSKQILAYPDEVATLDMNNTYNISVNSDNPPMARLEGVDIVHVWQYGIVSDPSKAGFVIRNVRFVDGIEGNSPSENPAFIHGWGDTSSQWRHKLLVQDNDFGSYVMKSSGAYAMTLFDAGESLIENNQIRLGATTGGIHDKDNSQHNTYRENFIEFSAANKVAGGIQISAQANADRVHIHHNLMINAGVYLGIQCFQTTCYMRDHDVHHNSLAGGSMRVNWGPFNPTSYGTRFTYNIISSGTSAPYGGLSCQARPANLATQMAASANLVESSHSLAFKDSECTGNDMNWMTWQGTYGFDTLASGSALTANSALTGSGPLIGLPAGNALRGLRGHQLP